jgi:hypothetical protein
MTRRFNIVIQEFNSGIEIKIIEGIIIRKISR